MKKSIIKMVFIIVMNLVVNVINTKNAKIKRSELKCPHKKKDSCGNKKASVLLEL